jgi:hypothetical protein
VSPTSAIGSPSSGSAADLARVRSEEPFANQAQEASFKLALAGANVQPAPAAGAPASPPSLDQTALNAADEAWVNFVAVSEQLQNPQLSQEKQNALLVDLAENLRTFRQQSGPLLQQVDDFFASRQATGLKSGEV